MSLGNENARAQSWEHKLDDMGTDGPRLSAGRPAPGHLCDEHQDYEFCDTVTGQLFLITLSPGVVEMRRRWDELHPWGPVLNGTRQP